MPQFENCVGFSGPTTAQIQNADRAVATVTNLVAGEYKFRLTVKDAEGLTGSAVVAITVHESLYIINLTMKFLDYRVHFIV